VRLAPMPSGRAVIGMGKVAFAPWRMEAGKLRGSQPPWTVARTRRFTKKFLIPSRVNITATYYFIFVYQQVGGEHMTCTTFSDVYSYTQMK